VLLIVGFDFHRRASGVSDGGREGWRWSLYGSMGCGWRDCVRGISIGISVIIVSQRLVGQDSTGHENLARRQMEGSRDTRNSMQKEKR